MRTTSAKWMISLLVACGTVGDPDELPPDAPPVVPPEYSGPVQPTGPKVEVEFSVCDQDNEARRPILKARGKEGGVGVIILGLERPCVPEPSFELVVSGGELQLVVDDVVAEDACRCAWELTLGIESVRGRKWDLSIREMADGPALAQSSVFVR